VTITHTDKIKTCASIMVPAIMVPAYSRELRAHLDILSSYQENNIKIKNILSKNM